VNSPGRPTSAEEVIRAGRLQGKVAIITGAAGGLGAEIARNCAEEGASVVVADIRAGAALSVAESIRAAGGDAIAVPADVTDRAAVQGLLDACVSHYGQLDVMIANAAVLGEMGVSLADSSEIAFRQAFDVNLFGVYYCFKHAVPMIAASGDGTGTLLATTSVAAHRGVPRLDAYSASKAAILGLVRSLAADLAPKIRVNSVSPTTMQTSIADHAGSSPASLPAGSDRPRHRAVITDLRKVAAAFVYLASDDGSLVTGQALCIDAGRTVFD
jgi:NAD(P)-dependent dehydrogenase (short-subunit alcohol dehydrogenase family)